MTCTSSGIGCSPQPQGCPDQYGCVKGVCPDFTLRRHDTKPAFKVKMEDCDGPMDLTGLVLESTMWAKGKLKKPLAVTDTYFALADNIGFHQIMVGDIIIMDRSRLPEHMLVTGFDEDNYLVLVERAYHGTTAQKWKKGTPLRIMKFIGATSQTEMLYQDIIEMDGTTTENSLVDSFFVYEWGPNDTCLPGCYYLEFKLIKMLDAVVPDEPTDLDGDGDIDIVFSPSTITWTPSEIVLPDITPSPSTISGTNIVPSFISDTPSTLGCGVGAGVDWVRRFPVDSEGFLIKIMDSPTAEN